MNFMDVFLCVGLIFGIIGGFRKGFFVELASLVALLLGIFIAIKFSYLMKTYLESHGFSGSVTVSVAAFALTFIAVVVGISILAKFFTKMADFTNLGWANNLLGAVFGLLKSILMLSILLNLLQKVNFDYTFVTQKTITESKLHAPVQKVSQMIYPAIADWFAVFKSEAYEMKKPEE